MSDQWNTMQEPQPEQPESTPCAEQPAEQTAEHTPSVPYNGWSSDGSYRYVPPRSENAATPRYTSPAQPSGNDASGYSANQNYQQMQSPKPPRKNSSGWLVAIAIVGALAVVVSVVFLGLGFLTADKTPPTSSEVSQAEGSEQVDMPLLEISDWDDNDGGLSTREVVSRNLDSTVVLTMYAQSQNFAFGESTMVEAGSASGIVMSEDGYIITNWHCVTNENTGKAFDEIIVTTHDGQEYEGVTVIGSDESTDLAVIKVDAQGLSVAQFGDSSQLQVGDRCIALGNAAGLSWTATQGIISALARDVYDDTGYAIKCLQTDAAINPGNSGGPLLNNQGMVIGINSSKIASNGYEGLGFSIPINEAKTIIDSLMKNGYVKGRVALGIMGQTISSGMYNGFMITEISEDSCFEGTDVTVGDLIVAVDDTEVGDYGELRSELAKHSIGDKVTLKLLRSNSRTGRVTSYTVTVTLKEQTVANN